MLARHSGPIDLLITDVILPDSNDQKLAHRLAQEIHGLRTLFVSGYTSNASAHHGELDGDLDF